jgi:hypothetical protein
MQHTAAVRMPVEKRAVSLDLQQQNVVTVLNGSVLVAAAVSRNLMNGSTEEAVLPLLRGWRFPMILSSKVLNIFARGMNERPFRRGLQYI